MSENKAEKKTKANKKTKSKIAAVVVLVFVAIFMIIGIFGERSGKGKEVETVMIGTAEDKISVSGYVIRDEVLVNAPESGVLSFRANEGERISKSSPVAVIYSGGVSDDVKSELSSIHQHINEIEGSSVEKNLFAGDVTGGSSQIETDIDMISQAVYKGDVSNVTQYKDDIIRLIRKDTGEEATAQTTLEKLRARKKELENSISGKATTIYSVNAGVMCSQIDGCEEYFNIKNLDKITPSYLRSCPEADLHSPDTVEKGQPCLKIINNYEWYFTAQVDEDWITDMKVGNTVLLRFTDISDNTMEGTVYSISDPQDGKVAIVVKSRSIYTGMYTTRAAKAEIIRKTYKGFKVSKDAVHIDTDGSYYVFVNSEGVARRRDVKVLYADDAYVILKQDNSASNNLLLYDEVIISENEVKAGDSV